METLITLVLEAIAILIIVFLFVTLLLSKNNLFNGRCVYNKEIKPVQFEVLSAESTFDSENNHIVKYTVSTVFFDKKHKKWFHYNTFIFYGKQGEYNVGDKLTIIKTN